MLKYTVRAPAPFWSNFNGNFIRPTSGPHTGGLTGSYVLGGAATLAKALTSTITDAMHKLNQRATQSPTSGNGFSGNAGTSSPIFGGRSGSGEKDGHSLFGLNTTPEAQKANAGAKSFLRHMLSPYADLEAEKAKFKATEDYQKHRIHPYFKVNDFGSSTSSQAAPSPNAVHNFMGEGGGGGNFGGGSFSFGNMGNMGGGNMGGGGGGNPFGGGGQGNLFDKMLEWCSVSHAKDIARRMGIDMRDIKFSFGANGECNVKVDAPNATPLQIAQLGEAVQQECPVARFRKSTLKSDEQKMKWELLSQR